VVVLALAAALVPQAAHAATPAPTGIDVSYPNCGTLLPSADFVVVGINAGRGRTDNPCRADQLALAAAAPGTAHTRLDVYVNTQNPTPTQAQSWPTGDVTFDGHRMRSPYGRCTGGKSQACSWIYGASIARDDVARLTSAGFTGRVGRWWLDVETANSWSASTGRNRAALEGMAAALTEQGQRVGLYALPGEFRDLIGTVPASSRLTALPSWIAGAADQAHAAQLCTRSPLTAGRVLLVQFKDVAAALDRDVACGTLTTKQATVKGTFRAKHRLTARTGTWGPGKVRLTYRWLRAGKPISGAVHSTYVLRAADKGHSIRVRITGTESGYTPAVRTSAGHRVAR
jgi:hypothetical protein